MKFTTPCFVRVEDAEKRKELAVWLSSIGRYVSPAVTSSDYHKDWVIVTEPYDPDLDGYVGIWAKTPKSPAFIDCGENIELFKALAAMNDENDLNQWYVCDVPYWCDLRQGDWVIKRDTMDHTTFFPSVFHKATVAEIIEHFKKREK
jgi:hypothetical protein